MKALAEPLKEAAAPASPRQGSSSRTNWLIVFAAGLAAAAAVAGSIWLGVAALLPFLYLLPCMAMAAMCLRHSTKE